MMTLVMFSETEHHSMLWRGCCRVERDEDIVSDSGSVVLFIPRPLCYHLKTHRNNILPSPSCVEDIHKDNFNVK